MKNRRPPHRSSSSSIARPIRPEFATFTASENLYEILGVPHDATLGDIKREYRRLAIVYHPDKHADQDKPTATQIFQKISLAYHTLSDPARRKEYDRQLSWGSTARVADEARHEQIDPLAEILAQLHAHTDLFSDDHLHLLDKDMQTFVGESLNREIHERVVGAVGLTDLPKGIAKPEGNFDSGSMVFTTVHIIFAFVVRWTESQGNEQITHTGMHLRSVPLRAVRRIVVRVKGRLQRSTTLLIETRGETDFELKPKTVNLARFFTLLTYWGVPITQQDVTSKTDDIDTTVWTVPGAIIGGVVALLIVALICGVCSGEERGEAGCLEAVFTLLFSGLGQLLVVISAIGFAAGKAKAAREYERKHLRDLVGETA